jgi:dTDP-4-dehydrorhamnose reductase
MRELIIGATGRIGKVLSKKLPDAIRTSSSDGNLPLLDLLHVKTIPLCDIVYICGGINGTKPCEGNEFAFRINVDGPVNVARIMAARGGFSVYISSMSIEWLGAAYQRQKLAAETILRTMPNIGIVRAGRVTGDNIEALCEMLIKVGRERIEDVTLWGTDNIAYTTELKNA